jgi:methionyl-tRNA formyltransferase
VVTEQFDAGDTLCARPLPVEPDDDWGALESRLMALAQEHEQRVLEPLGALRAEELKATLRRIVEMHQTGDVADA